MKRLRWERLALVLLILAALGAFVTALLGAPGKGLRITAPVNGARVSGTADVAVSVGQVTGIAYLIFAVDGVRMHSTNTMPYHYLLDTTELTNGRHEVTAEAYSRGGLLGRSPAIGITVENAPKPPPVSMRTGIRSEVTAPEASKPAPPVPAATPAPGPPAATAAPSAPTALWSPQPAQPKTDARLAGAAVATPSSRTAEAPAPATESAAELTPATAPRESVAAGALPPVEPALRSFHGERSRTTPTRVRVAVLPPKPAPAAAPTPAPEPRALPLLAARPSHPRLTLDGRILVSDVPARLRSGHLYAAFRHVFEQAGATVSWEARTRTGIARIGDQVIRVTEGRATALVNDKPIAIGARARIVQGRFVLPVRFICRVMAWDLGWNAREQRAEIVTGHSTVAKLTED